MIIVQLKGGLGNQFFQYAAGLSLAKHHNVKVKVDIGELNKPDVLIGTIRNFELQNISCPPVVASKSEINQFVHSNLFSRYFQKILPAYKRKVYKEVSPLFDRNFFEAGDHLYVKGYRQSELYFGSIRHMIAEHFPLKEHLVKHLFGFAQELHHSESIALHIRRGDYASTLLADYHGTLDKSYYQAALHLIEKKTQNACYFIFSDNVEWVKENLTFSGSVRFVSGQDTTNHYEDFYLMSQCRHNIIANSTFSWWAAWLNPNPKKIVIAPKKWYNKPRLDTSDLIPGGWIRI